jgi:arylsulfatase A-like enzyme
LGSKAEWGPNKYGFDHSYGALAGGTGPFDHRYKTGEYTANWHRNGKFITEEGHVTDLIAREAIRWIEARDAQPFFLYLPFTAPHIPIDEPARWVEMYPEIESVTKRQYAASVTHLDDAVGQVMAALERTGKLANTLIVFTSDNGATPTARNDDPQYPGTYPAGPAGGTNLPLRGKKTELWEGGIRVPAFAYWPGKLKPGKLAAPLHAVDWMPTLCGLADWKASQDLKWDGRNIWPWLTREASPRPRQLYWAGTGFRTKAVRDGDWKLVLQVQSAKVELFNLAKDPYEESDLSLKEPGRVEQLKALLTKLAAADTKPRASGVE